MTDNPVDAFTVDPGQIEYIGKNLRRPECILAERDGTLWSADARGGVVPAREAELRGLRQERRGIR